MRRRRISTPPVVNRARQMTAPQPDRDLPEAMKPAMQMQNFLSQQPGRGMNNAPTPAPTPPLQQQAQMAPVKNQQTPHPFVNQGRPPHVVPTPVPPPPPPAPAQPTGQGWNPEATSPAAQMGVSVQPGPGGWFLDQNGQAYSPQGWPLQEGMVLTADGYAVPNPNHPSWGGQGGAAPYDLAQYQAPAPVPNVGPGWNPGMPGKNPGLVSTPPLQQQASMGPVQPPPVQAHQQVGNMVGQIPPPLQQQAQMGPAKNQGVPPPHGRPVITGSVGGTIENPMGQDWNQPPPLQTPTPPPGDDRFPPMPEIPTPTPPPVGPPGVTPEVGGLPLSPQAEAVRRTLEDELSRELASVGVQRDQLPAMLNLITARLQSDLDEELRLTDESANARGVFNSGIRTNSRKRVNDAASRQKQDIATDFASRYSDLANRESGAYGNFNRGLAEMLLTLANDMAQDPNAPVGGSDNESDNQDQRDGNWTRPSRNRRNRKPRKNKKGGKGGN